MKVEGRVLVVVVILVDAFFPIRFQIDCDDENEEEEDKEDGGEVYKLIWRLNGE